MSHEMLFARMAWRNVWRHGRRSALTVGAILLGVAFTILFEALGEGFHEQMVDNSVRAHIAHLEVHLAGYHDNPALSKTLPEAARVEASVRQLAGLRGYSLRVLGDGLVSNAESSAGVQLVGVDPSQERTVTTVHQGVIAGKYLEGTGRPALLGDRLAAKLKAGLGDKVVVMGQAADGSLAAQLFRVDGIFRSGSPELDQATLYIRRSDAQELFALGSRVTEAAVLLGSSQQVDAARATLRGALNGSGVEVLAWYEVEPFLRQFIEMDDAFIMVIAAILFIVVSIGILNTIMMSVFERVREFGVMMALGTRPKQVVALVVEEALLLGLVGVVLGALAGSAVAGYYEAKGIDLSAWSQGIQIAGITTSIVNPRLTPGIVAGACGVVLALVVLVSIYPAARAARLRPIDAIRHT